jgi:eukaryotic-like serine/threonine-protein kinase
MNDSLVGDRRKQIEELFLTAVDLPEAGRLALLDSCPDPAVAREVDSLLRHYSASPNSLDRVVSHAAASLLAGDSMIGVRLGAYRITEEIGKGGMGAVFLALRDDQTFEKKVAVKVVKRGMDTDAVIGRFRHERRILSNLDHPCIARLLDAGTTPDGRPYFVMEYVEGEPIAAYVRNQKLDRPAILELFRKVCGAVAHAHRNLVVHRDLKAGNILVSPGGSPKLLDFGIAKLLDPQSRAEDTSPASRLLTLDCASPEQIQGGAVTTSTDIYSLGILLFELIAGRPPWQFSGMSQAEAAQIICATPAPKPSQAVRVKQRGRREIDSDLDNIVLMALRKDPARRYRSVDEFSEDLHRYLAGLPVIAREDSFSYRTAKLLRRHWVAVTLATGAVLALLVGIFYANLERRQAEVRLTQMLGLANQTLFDLHAQIERQPGSTATRMRVTQSTLAYLANLARDAGDNREVRSTLAKAYLAIGDIQGYPDDPNLGDSTGALSSYETAEKFFEPLDHIPRARTYWHRGVVLFKLGHVPEGLAMLRKSVDEARQSSSRDALLIRAGAYHSIAYALAPSHPEEALATSRLEMDVYAKLAPYRSDDVEVLNGLADSYISVGGALVRSNSLEEALELFRKAAAALEPLLARNPSDFMISRDLMNAYMRTGDVLGNPARRNLGDWRGALPYFRKAESIAQAHASADPENHLAQMDLMEARWRIAGVMEDPRQAGASLRILNETADLISAQPETQFSTAQLRAAAVIDLFRGRRLGALRNYNGAVAAYRRSIQEGLALAGKDTTDASTWGLLMLNYRELPLALVSLRRREEALRAGQETVEKAAWLQSSMADRASVALFVPRSQAWLAATYEELAGQETSPQQRRADWLAAAQIYTRAVEAWQPLQGRGDFFRYRSELSECEKRAAECNRRAKAKL